MKKKATLSLILFFSLALFSQSIKVKKGVILYEDKPVGLIERKSINDESNYTCWDTAHNLIFTSVEKWYKYDPAKEPYRWLVFENADKTKKTELSIDDFRVYFTNENVLMKTLGKVFHLFDMNGFNKDSIQAFFNVERPSLTAKYLGQKEINDKLESQGKKALEEIYPLVSDDNSTITGYNNRKPIGKFQMVSADDREAKFNVLDLDNNVVANVTWTMINYSNSINVNTYRNQQISLDGSRSDFTDSKNQSLKKIAEKLISRGYLLQHQIAEEQAKIRQEKQAKIDLENAKIKAERDKIEAENFKYKFFSGSFIDNKGNKFSGQIYYQPYSIKTTGKRFSDIRHNVMYFICADGTDCKEFKSTDNTAMPISSSLISEMTINGTRYISKDVLVKGLLKSYKNYLYSIKENDKFGFYERYANEDASIIEYVYWIKSNEKPIAEDVSEGKLLDYFKDYPKAIEAIKAKKSAKEIAETMF